MLRCIVPVTGTNSVDWEPRPILLPAWSLMIVRPQVHQSSIEA